jgi:hypothetical protein
MPPLKLKSKNPAESNSHPRISDSAYVKITVTNRYFRNLLNLTFQPA